MSSINARLAAAVTRMLDAHGFDVDLQKCNTPSNDFDSSPINFTSVATVRAVWDAAGYSDMKLMEGRAASETRLYMHVAYREELKDTVTASGHRISYNGRNYSIEGAAVIGDKVAVRLTLNDGFEP